MYLYNNILRVIKGFQSVHPLAILYVLALGFQHLQIYNLVDLGCEKVGELVLFNDWKPWCGGMYVVFGNTWT
jgi:hypothetical protein